ncbi:hypothetical protein DFH08DRAFT_783222 [Mycena albidolilacea]|uniref:Uncharacterized protein n=1 Tax=Mycena albidolilacea TaxID=1033008 RepID=A0AAD6ZUY8_9AGAR|nr:hypothetical protein DFH08DRAFT_783222 [Mycena albidolilacea]
MSNYGRNRESIADIQLELHNIFIEHPDATIAEDGNPVIPADALVDVFQAFSEQHGGTQLLSADDIILFKDLIANNPGIEVTPQLAIGFVAEKTKHSPPQSPSAEEPRGRSDDRDESNSRSSSSDSVGTHRNHSRGPQTPRSAASPFDTSRRQRSTPLGGPAPSSWAKRPPQHRRKSDAGSKSDTEGVSASPSAFGRAPAGRTRAPSNPTSPSTSTAEFDFSPTPRSRPPSRQREREEHHDDFDYTLRQGLSSLPMPRPGSDSDSDSDDDAGDMVRDGDPSRSTASSSASLVDPSERVAALQRVNADLARKLADTERAMQRKLAEQESEFEELQGRLEETRNELTAAKREEKELRGKERQSNTQISALEAELTKLTRQLETAKASYTLLQKQYLDQCSRAEKYRDDLRERDVTVRSLQDSAALTQIEVARYTREHEVYEERIGQLERELEAAREVWGLLEGQKVENMVLKETIDRMRFDLDEMRSAAASGGAGGGGGMGGSGRNSVVGSVSKSLGAELLGKMGGWGLDGDPDAEAEETEEEGDSSATPGEDEDTEGEDVIQTIITRKKRKVASRAMAPTVEHRAFEETKEYSDAGTQYEPHLFFFSKRMQTDAEPKVLTASMNIQTEPEPEPEVEPTPAKAETAEMEVQTEPVEVKEVKVEEESEPEPEAGPSTSVPTDAPPAYKQVLSPEEQAEHDWRVTIATLKKYHPGTARVGGEAGAGVSLDALEDWRALKEELGVSCVVVDELLAGAASTGLPRAPSDAAPAQAQRRRSGGRFYNIYNTYVYPKNNPNSNASPFPAIPPPALWVGGTLLFVLMLGPSIMLPYYSPPGGATAYDRAVWSSFNTVRYAGEGFAIGGPDAGWAGGGGGAGEVWSFLGRVGGGAARMVRGWPT